MDGAINTCGTGIFWANAGAENTVASYLVTNWLRNFQIFGSGLEKSIWQRQTQRLPTSLRFSINAMG
jgi:hypothetical protein